MLPYAVGLSSWLTTGPARGCCLTQTFLAPMLPCTSRKNSLKLRRQRQVARVRVALAACSLATAPPSARGGTDVVLGYRLRLPAADFHDLSSTAVPASDFAEGTSHAEGECIVKWLGGSAARTWACKTTVIRAVVNGRLPRPLPAVSTGNQCPAVKSHPIRCAAELYAVAARKGQIAGIYRSASVHHGLARGPKRLAKPKVEDETPGIWGASGY